MVRRMITKDPGKDGNDHDLARTDPGQGRTNPPEVLSPLSHNGKEAEAGRGLEENIPGDLAPSNPLTEMLTCIIIDDL